MAGRRRDGIKAWSHWEHYTLASLGPHDLKRFARTPPLTSEQVGQRRWRAILGVLGAIMGIALITGGLAIGGPRVRQAAFMVFVGLSVPIPAASVWLVARVRFKDLIRLRRRRVAVTRGLHAPETVAAAVEAIRERRRAAADPIRNHLEIFRGCAMVQAHPVSALYAGWGISFILIFQSIESAIPGLPPWIAPLALLTSFGLFIAAVICFRTERRRLLASASGTSCPDCGYSLDTVRPATIAAPELAAEVGPAVCPECGCPWPLVPPEQNPHR